MNDADDRTITRRLATACAVIMALAATGCGNKGGLVLPEKPPVQSQEEAVPSKDAGDQGTSTDKSTQQPKGY